MRQGRKLSYYRVFLLRRLVPRLHKDFRCTASAFFRNRYATEDRAAIGFAIFASISKQATYWLRS
jgi:hypothetical protein